MHKFHCVGFAMTVATSIDTSFSDMCCNKNKYIHTDSFEMALKLVSVKHFT